MSIAQYRFRTNEEVVSALRGLMKKLYLSPLDTAMSLGLRESELNELLTDGLNPRTVQWIPMIREWVLPKIDPDTLGTIQTPTFKRLRELIMQAYDEKDIIVIGGRSGYGKTFASKQIALTEPFVYYVSARVSQGGKDLLTKICKRIGIGIGQERTVSRLQDKIIEFFKHHSGLIIIDEADKLDNRVWDNLREIYDEVQTIGLVFIGEEQIQTKLILPDHRGNRLTRMISRTEDVIEIDEITKTDVREYLEQNGIVMWKNDKTRNAWLKVLTEKAQEFGGFRHLNKIIKRIANREAAGQLDATKEIPDDIMASVLASIKEIRYGR